MREPAPPARHPVPPVGHPHAVIDGRERPTGWRNWAGNQGAEPVRTVVAQDAGDVAEAVRAATRDGLRVKALGSGHSFTGIGAPEGVAVLAPSSPHLLHVTADGLATVPAGMTLRTLDELLWRHGRRPAQPRRHRRADGRGRDLHRHPRHRRDVPRPRRAGPGPGDRARRRVDRAVHRRRAVPARPDRSGRARGPHERHARDRPGAPAARRRGDGAATRGPRGARRRRRPRRGLLVPATPTSPR